MINWSHRAESLIKKGLNENGRGEIEESEYRQLLGAASTAEGNREVEQWLARRVESNV